MTLFTPFRHLLPAAGLLLLMGNAVADEDQDVAKQLMEQGDILPLEKILEQARLIHPGRILEAEMEHKGEIYVYEIEIVDEQGRVWELKLNAQTGALVDKEKKD
jgi:uncharacterized membrane protein YkoI